MMSEAPWDTSKFDAYMEASSTQSAHYDDGIPLETHESGSQARPDHMYRWTAETSTLGQTVAGTHNLTDTQRTCHQFLYGEGDLVKTTVRNAKVTQTMTSSTVDFVITVHRERAPHGPPTETLIDETFKFSFDIGKAMSHLSGWNKEVIDLIPAPARPLAILPPPPARQRTQSPPHRSMPANSTAPPAGSGARKSKTRKSRSAVQEDSDLEYLR